MFARLAFVAAIALLSLGATPAETRTKLDQAARARWVASCKDWDKWLQPGPGFRIYGNTYYVGTCGIGAILVTGDKGNILIDGGPEGAAEPVAANIGRLGFKLEDVKILLHTHEHLDHVGAFARLKELTGAQLWASPAAARAIGSGKAIPEDPQYSSLDGFPPVWVDKVLQGDPTVKLGDITLHGIATPGHTLGALSWHWRSCEGGKCKEIAYIDSLSAVSSDDYRYADHPELVAQFRRSLKRVAALPCDILLSPHPSASGMRGKLVKGDLAGPPHCKAYAADLRKKLDGKLAKEAVDAGK